MGWSGVAVEPSIIGTVDISGWFVTSYEVHGEVVCDIDSDFPDVDTTPDVDILEA